MALCLFYDKEPLLVSATELPHLCETAQVPLIHVCKQNKYFRKETNLYANSSCTSECQECCLRVINDILLCKSSIIYPFHEVRERIYH